MIIFSIVTGLFLQPEAADASGMAHHGMMLQGRELIKSKRVSAALLLTFFSRQKSLLENGNGNINNTPT